MQLNGLTIGIMREIMEGERRVAATPETVAQMVTQGAVILVETQAGQGSFFTDQDYQAAGAKIADRPQPIYDQADIILKVKEPLPYPDSDTHEIDMMKPGQLLITFIHPASPCNHTMVKQLAAQGVISLSLDSIPRITRAQSMDALTSMSTVAGYKGLLMAADKLMTFMPMVGTAVGMIPPAKVLVVGCGVAGLQSLATAKRLGAEVHAADIRPDACEQAQSLGAKLLDLEIPAEYAVGQGGYAQSLPPQWLKQEQDKIAQLAPNMDIIILAALIPAKLAPVLIAAPTVASMKAGSVIVDIAIDQGGNCELTQGGKCFDTQNGVHIIGTKNIPGMMPKTSTWMFAKNIYNLLTHITDKGKINLDTNDEIISKALVTRDGQIVHQGTLEAINTPAPSHSACQSPQGVH